MKYTHDFGSTLKKIRKNHGITQERLAKILGVTGTNISKYENNAVTPPLEIMCSISDYFKIPLDTLCGTETSESISTAGLTKEQVSIVKNLVSVFKSKNIKMPVKITDEQYQVLGKIIENFYSKNKR